MTALRQAAVMALNVLEANNKSGWYSQEINTLKKALAQPEQEPIAWICKKNGKSWLAWNSTEHVPSFSTMEPLYLHPAPIPEGWQLVPIDPTDEMLQIAIDINDGFRNGYKAMLAATPKPEDV